MELKAGMLVRSKKGRDKNCIYVIISVKDEYVYLADGDAKPLCHLKKKNQKHIQPIKKAGIISVTDNKAIKESVKRFEKRDTRK